MAIDFEFARVGNIGAGSSWDLGHITIRVGVNEYSSKSRSMACMVYVAISDLLTGIEQLISGANLSFEFLAADSSFAVLFKKQSCSIELIVEKTRLLGAVSESEIRNTLVKSVENFLMANSLGNDEPIRQDILSGIQALQSVSLKDR